MNACGNGRIGWAHVEFRGAYMSTPHRIVDRILKCTTHTHDFFPLRMHYSCCEAIFIDEISSWWRLSPHRMALCHKNCHGNLCQYHFYIYFFAGKKICKSCIGSCFSLFPLKFIFDVGFWLWDVKCDRCNFLFAVNFHGIDFLPLWTHRSHKVKLLEIAQWDCEHCTVFK